MMKKYEVSIERSQPICGGKSPTVQQFVEVQTDDPLSYVLQNEKDRTFTSSVDKNGDLVFESTEGAQRVTYVFTEI